MSIRAFFFCLAFSLVMTPAHADGDIVGGPPDSPLVLAEQAIQDGKWRDALRHLQKAEKEDAKNPAIYNWQGYAARKLGNLDDAFRYYGIALRLDPNHKGANEYIGEAYLMAGKPDMAREHLARLEKICGTSCEQYRDLAAAIDKYPRR